LIIKQTLIHLQLISFNTLLKQGTNQVHLYFVVSLYQLRLCLDAALSAISFALSAPSFLSELMLTNCSLSCPTIRS
jgi:hypothetical protein